MPQQSQLSAFINELRRRRVFRVAAFYGGIAFVIVQIIDGTFEVMGIPAWVSRLVIIFLALGFPISVILAWVFDITPGGIVRTSGRTAEPTSVPSHPIVGNRALVFIAIAAIAVGIWVRWGSEGDTQITSIAVLPLSNLMGDPDQDYFVDGMHEAIISNLSRLSGLKVISRTSAMRYKGTDKLLPEIARELNVDALVEGSVMKAGNRVRITAQLIHGASDEHLWANDYEGDLTDILSLQKTIAGAIAREIGLTLKPEEEAYLASAPQVNPEAYNLFLKGWHFRKLHDYAKAFEYLEQAVALDSTFARAWAALGYVSAGIHGLTTKWGNIVYVEKGFSLMLQAINKALDLDPNQPLAHTHLGLYQWFKWDYIAAEASFKRALELDHDNATALFEYGLVLLRIGRPDESLELFQRSMMLDPLDKWPYEGISNFYGYTRQYEKELETSLLWEEIEGRPGNNSTIEQNILLQQGHYAEVVEQAGVNSIMGIRALMAMGNVAEVYAFRDSLRSTGELGQREQEIPNWSARYYASMGERDMALSLLERAYEDSTKEWNHSINLVYAPEFDFLRAEPRFKVLLKKMGLREVFDQYGQRIQ